MGKENLLFPDHQHAMKGWLVPVTGVAKTT
jgi:hypothetical protein